MARKKFLDGIAWPDGTIQDRAPFDIYGIRASTLLDSHAMSSGVSLGDAFIKANSMLFAANVNISPGKIYKWADPTDLSTLSTLTMTNTASSEQSPINMLHDPGTDKIYIVWQSYFNGTNNVFQNKISAIDPAAFTASLFLDLQFDDQASTGSPPMCSDGTYLYVVSSPSTTYHSILKKIRLSDAAVMATKALTNTHAHTAIYDFTNNSILITGTNARFTTKTAWAAKVDNALTTETALTMDNDVLTSDDSVQFGDYYFVGDENNVLNNSRLYRINKATTAYSSLTVNERMYCAGMWAGKSVIYALFTDDVNPPILATIDPIRFQVLQKIQLDATIKSGNRIILDGDQFYVTTLETTSTIARFRLKEFRNTLHWFGQWVNNILYDAGDVVTDAGTVYIANTRTSTEPPGSDWDVHPGDASTNTTTSVDNELVLFSGTTGKLLKRATTSGILKGTSGVISAATAGADYQAWDADLDTIAALGVTNDSFIQGKAGAWAKRTVAQVLTDLAAAGTTFQPLDSDLTTIASLTPTTDNFIVAVASAWASRTPAQVKTTLALNNVDNTADSAKVVATAATLTTARNIDGQSFNGSADITVIAPGTHAATSKATPVDADEVPLVDSAASNALKRLTWANLKATLKTYLDTLYQPVDSDLTTIAGLTATTDNFIVAVASAWASRTPAQVKTTLALNNVDNTSNATERAATATLTNKRVTRRSSSTAGPGATPTINTDNVDIAVFTALAAAITSMTTNLSGTPTEGQTLWIAFTDNGTARAITWGTSFEASTVVLPTTTVISARLDVGFVWNVTTSKWRCVAVA